MTDPEFTGILNFSKVLPSQIALRFGSVAFSSIDYALSNESPELHKQLADLYVASTLSSIFSKKEESCKKFFKEMYADKLTTIGETHLTTIKPFKLISKVTSPRESFDKDAFINALSTKYDMSIIELRAIAATCTKLSAAPTGFRVELSEEGVF